MNTAAPVPQSNFITVLAWIMIVFGGFGILVGLMQNVMVNLVLPQFEATMSQGGPGMAFPLAYLRVMMLVALAFSVFMTYSAYALLKRRNWARMLYIVLFIISAALHVIVAAVLGLGFGVADFATVGADILPPAIQSAMSAMAITFLVFLLAMAVMYVWLVQRLRSPAIAAEFGVAPA